MPKIYPINKHYFRYHGPFINIFYYVLSTPLLIKKTGTDIIVEEFEFTFNRLVGLAAGFALENRRRFPNIKISDANALGLEWDNENEDKCKLYLSTLSGTEYLTHLFSFYPLLCGLRKFQLNKMPIKLVEKIGNIKNKEGMTMAAVLKANMVTAKRIWLMFPSVSLRELQTLIEDTPQLAKLFSR